MGMYRMEKFIVKPERGDRVKVYMQQGLGVRFGIVKNTGYVKKLDKNGRVFKRQIVVLREVEGVDWFIDTCRFALPCGKVILE